MRKRRKFPPGYHRRSSLRKSCSNIFSDEGLQVNSNGKYNTYDVLLYGTTSTICYSGSSMRSSSCGSIRSESEQSFSPLALSPGLLLPRFALFVSLYLLLVPFGTQLLFRSLYLVLRLWSVWLLLQDAVNLSTSVCISSDSDSCSLSCCDFVGRSPICIYNAACL